MGWWRNCSRTCFVEIIPGTVCQKEGKRGKKLLFSTNSNNLYNSTTHSIHCTEYFYLPDRPLDNTCECDNDRSIQYWSGRFASTGAARIAPVSSIASLALVATSWSWLHLPPLFYTTTTCCFVCHTHTPYSTKKKKAHTHPHTLFGASLVKVQKRYQHRHLPQRSKFFAVGLLQKAAVREV